MCFILPFCVIVGAASCLLVREFSLFLGSNPRTASDTIEVQLSKAVPLLYLVNWLNAENCTNV